jgi:pimeloyl-ACP methyl ester carboxylesterase
LTEYSGRFVAGGPESTTFVLIPGAGTDPRVYDATIAARRELGHDGIAPPLPLDDPEARPSDHAAAIAPLRERFGPPSEWDDAAMAEVFYHDVDAATLAASAEYEGRPGPGMFSEPLPPIRWPFPPTTVLIPREDRLFPPDFQRRLVRERLDAPWVEVVEIDGGHLPMLSRPRDLAERLVEVTWGPD